MKNHKIQDLKNKYWAAESSLAEESELRSLIVESGEESSVESALFQYFEKQRAEVAPVNVKVIKLKKRFNSRFLFGIAASMSIAVMSYFLVEQQMQPQRTTINDPEVALQVTMQAFGLINQKMEKSEASVLKNLKHFDKTLIIKN